MLLAVGLRPAAAAQLGFLLEPPAEEHLRRALVTLQGDPFVFLQPPVSLAIRLATTSLFVSAPLPPIAARRK